MNRNCRFSGGCNCGAIGFVLRNPPLFVHACHCCDCQKASGSAFRITTIVLENDITFVQGNVASRKKSEQRTEFVCKSCEGLIYLTATNHPATALLNSKTLDELRVLEIGAHIWTLDKHAWLELPADVPQFEKGYDRNKVWPQRSIERVLRAVNDNGPT